jgi:peptide/nickel transport system permease protein
MSKNDSTQSGLKETITGFFKNRISKINFTANLIIGVALLSGFVFIGIFAPYITPHDSDEMYYEHLKEMPSAEFLLGTDRYGRDILSRVMMGTRTTLLIASTSTLIALFLGIIFGATSAYFGGRTDNIMMRINDVFMSFPTLIFAMLVIGVLGPSMINGIIAIGIIYAPRVTRVVRSQALNIVHMEYIDAAKVGGESSFYIIFREMLPNLWPTIIVEGSIRLGYAILLTAGLGYIGLGPPPPTPDWGLMAYSERTYMFETPWPVFAPCLAIVIAVIGVNLFGEGLKDVLLAKGSRKKEAKV